eukprot:CAMPEP_0177636850 /NCGR_PEP_ID=MMETSP0447-20121125/4657_1 /TAXON_ID=0 /ORGANISM="Stygamoeba regulata, Strain BSH-02190019" /LENGTH=640 /DNA_ID=CAMNT_0019138737 /DNA_START=183 /DNA_END=2106 /DNA_ORIENTATION=+
MLKKPHKETEGASQPLCTHADCNGKSATGRVTLEALTLAPKPKTLKLGLKADLNHESNSMARCVGGIHGACQDKVELCSRCRQTVLSKGSSATQFTRCNNLPCAGIPTFLAKQLSPETRDMLGESDSSQGDRGCRHVLSDFAAGRRSVSTLVYEPIPQNEMKSKFETLNPLRMSAPELSATIFNFTPKKCSENRGDGGAPFAAADNISFEKVEVAHPAITATGHSELTLAAGEKAIAPRAQLSDVDWTSPASSTPTITAPPVNGTPPLITLPAEIHPLIAPSLSPNSTQRISVLMKKPLPSPGLHMMRASGLYRFTNPDDHSSTSQLPRNFRNKKIGKHYIILKQIGKGSFGALYRGLDLACNEAVAIKMESKSVRPPQLLWEGDVLDILGLRVVAMDGRVPEQQRSRDDLLGPNLQSLFEGCGRRFTLKTVLQIGRELITHMMFLHSKRLIHRDMKPDNFLIGVPPNHNKLYLIDFGLACFYTTPNDKHKAYKEKCGLVGNVRFASINNHAGIEQSRRDDLESLLYCLIYFLKGRLPWQGVKGSSHKEKLKKVGQIKQSISPATLCKGLPVEFCKLLQYIHMLAYDQNPDYDFMLSTLERLFVSKGFRHDGVFDWNLPQSRSASARGTAAGANAPPRGK